MTGSSSMDWHYLVRLSVQYYASGRFAALNQLYHIAPNLHHHAIELLLKAALIKAETLESVRQKYGHDLTKLWQAVIQDAPALKTSKRDEAIRELDRFEELRYPDRLISGGVAVTWAVTSGGNPVSLGGQPPRELIYNFNLEDIDELYAALFGHVRANPQVFLQQLTADARAAISVSNRHPIQP